MNDPHAMKVGKTFCERTNDTISFMFLENGTTTDITVQFTTSKEFHYNVNLLRGWVTVTVIVNDNEYSNDNEWVIVNDYDRVIGQWVIVNDYDRVIGQWVRVNDYDRVIGQWVRVNDSQYNNPFINSYSIPTSFDSNVSNRVTMFSCWTSDKIAISVWINSVSFYNDHLSLVLTSVNRFLSIILTAYSVSVFFSIHYGSFNPILSYSINLSKSSFTYHLTHIIIVFNMTHSCHFLNSFNPTWSFLFRTCIEFTIISSWELNPESKILRIFVIWNTIP